MVGMTMIIGTLLFTLLLVSGAKVPKREILRQSNLRSSRSIPPKNEMKILEWDEFEFTHDFVIGNRTMAALALGGMLYKIFSILISSPMTNSSSESGEIKSKHPYLRSILRRNFYFEVCGCEKDEVEEGEKESERPKLRELLCEYKNNLEKLFIFLEEEFGIDPYCHLVINTFLLFVLCNHDDTDYKGMEYKFKSIRNYMHVLTLALIPNIPTLRENLKTFVKQVLGRANNDLVHEEVSLLFSSGPEKLAQNLSIIVNNTTYNAVRNLLLESDDFLGFLFPNKQSDLRLFITLLNPKLSYSFGYRNLKKIIRGPNYFRGNVKVAKVFRPNTVMVTEENLLVLLTGKKTLYMTSEGKVDLQNDDQQFKVVFKKYVRVGSGQFLLYIVPEGNFPNEMTLSSYREAIHRLSFAGFLILKGEPMFLYFCYYNMLGTIKIGL